jgi:phosphomannomutase
MERNRKRDKMKNIVLFDLDGTLTPPREEMTKSMTQGLFNLLKHSEVGIVTGSPLEYVREQCQNLLCSQNDLLESLMIFPCNGTQEYSWDIDTKSFLRVGSTNMAEALGHKEFESIMQKLVHAQSSIVDEHDIPLTGHFISYRESMINWCPIGRNATAEDRKRFLAVDEKHGIRDKILLKLRLNLNLDKVRVVKGGQTSFDIYPVGWDKTYVLSRLDDFESITFVGDACHSGGNDYELYVSEELSHRYHVSSPGETEKIIEENLIPQAVSYEG